MGLREKLAERREAARKDRDSRKNSRQYGAAAVRAEAGLTGESLFYEPGHALKQSGVDQPEAPQPKSGTRPHRPAA